MSETIEGVGPGTPTTTNQHGASQSDIPYRCDLIDGYAMLSIAKVLHKGANRYGVNNWRNIPAHEHLNHALTHIYAHLAGDTQDHHLDHALTRLMMVVACNHGSAPEVVTP